MSTIVRCRHCHTFVYDTVERCHGCGERPGRHRLLGRASWVFILVVTLGFTGIRTLILAQEQRDVSQNDGAAQAAAQSFVKAWLNGDPARLRRAMNGDGSSATDRFVSDLTKLRQRWPAVAPTPRRDGVTVIAISPHPRPVFHVHEDSASDRGPLVHLASDMTRTRVESAQATAQVSVAEGEDPLMSAATSTPGFCVGNSMYTPRGTAYEARCWTVDCKFRGDRGMCTCRVDVCMNSDRNPAPICLHVREMHDGDGNVLPPKGG